jgi:acetylornithine deacetylase/succinyl-diaminopimelate desuccinylase-like protein
LSLPDALAYLDANTNRSIADLQRVLRQPSVTTDEADCAACAELVAAMMREAGLEAQVLPAKRNPMVYGQSVQNPGRPTLLVTGHYDVVTAEPRAAWSADPFGAELRGEDIISRGAVDPKGNLMAGIRAAEAFLRTDGELPINVKWLIEGDDEIDLGNLGAFVDEHRDLLKCDAVLLLDAGFTRDNNSPVHLGSAGSLGVDLRVTTGAKEPYFIWTQIVPDAAFRLVWALATLKDNNERVLVDGFYDGVSPPTDEERSLMADYPWRDDGELEFWGIRQFVGGVKGLAAIERLLYSPTCSIHGFEPSAGRPAGSSLIPCKAQARVNFHLVPNQHPDDILQMLKSHFVRHGFPDVEIEVFRSFAPIAGSAHSPLGQAVLRAAAPLGISTYLLPHSFEFGDKWCWLGQRLDVEGALIGIGDPDRRAHFPNEHITLSYYLNGIKWVSGIFWEFARGGGA